MSDKKNNFLKGAALLGAAGILVKFLGMFFRIPLGNFIEDDGMSYYQTAYPIYNWLLVISTAGIPTAIAKLVSEKRANDDYYGVNQTLKVSFALLSSIGFLSMVALFILAPFIVAKANNEPALYSMYAIAPALFFVSVMSVFRGYFQGFQKLKSYAISQVVEQLFRVVVGLSMALYLLNQSKAFAAAGATFGASVGAFVGTIFMLLYYWAYKKDLPKPVRNPNVKAESNKTIVKRLLKIAIPVTIGASVLPIMNIIDLGIVINRLVSIGFPVEEARKMYGQLTGYAATVVNLPMIVTAAVQISIVPAVAHLVAKKDNEEIDKTIKSGIRMGLIIGLPCTIGIVTLAKQIMMLLYPLKIEIALNAGEILALLGWGVVGLGMFQVLTGVLQGLGRPGIPARNLFFAAICKVALSYILIGIPALNIKGAAISTATAYIVAAILNYISIKKLKNLKLDVNQTFIKPLIDVAVMGVVVLVAYRLSYWVLGMMLDSMTLINAISTLVGVFLGMLAYGVMLIATKTLTEDDYDMLPGGSKLKKIADRFNMKHTA